jgi:hypothetical protein
VSYVWEDADFVDTLVAHLRTHGLKVWSGEAVCFGAEWPGRSGRHRRRRSWR